MQRSRNIRLTHRVLNKVRIIYKDITSCSVRNLKNSFTTPIRRDVNTSRKTICETLIACHIAAIKIANFEFALNE